MTTYQDRLGARDATVRAVAIAALVCAGCSLDRSAIGATDDDGGGGHDAGCAPVGTETCNGADDDCDGVLDEGFDLASDVAHCGACGRACAAGPRSTASCEAGACVLACEPGFADCNLEASDGCEASLSAATSCGSCDLACSAPRDLCADLGAGSVECVERCPGATMLCGTSCVDTGSSALHCGGCDAACEVRDGAIARCADGTCEHTCAAGRADCDAIPSNGCETDLRTSSDCGACGATCAIAGATASCSTGSCAFVACSTGAGDCDSDRSNGCETSLDSTSDCGACGTPCAFANGVASCAGGTCRLLECESGFGDCDAIATNGCETDLRSAPGSCGVCGRTCGGSELCVSGGCLAADALVQVAAGDDFTCGRLADGRVYCWGDNGAGQLGDGTMTNRATAAPVSGIDDAIDVTSGASHACAVRAGGGVVCWGENSGRQLGDGTNGDRSTPVAAGGITDARSVSAGDEHTCVVRGAGTVSCWGGNGQLQLGTTGGDRGTSMDVPGVTSAVQVASGADHTCALLAGGGVTCWGDNDSGQLARGATSDRSSTAMPAMGVSDATWIDSGDDFTCVVRGDGGVSCWGDNSAGQLGDGTTTERSTPVSVMGATSAERVSAGFDHVCLSTTAGAVACWGLGGSGQLGDGGTSDRRSPGPAVSGLTAIDVTAGGDHSCAARASGAGACWGNDSEGELGEGTIGGGSSTPVAVTGLP